MNRRGIILSFAGSMGLALVIAAVTSQAALGQSSTPSITATPAVVPGADMWAAFPKPDSSRPFLDYAGAWPRRWGFTGPGVQGVIADIAEAPLKPIGGGPNFLVEGEPRDGKLLREVASFDGPIDWRMEGPGSFVFRFPLPREGEKVAKSRRNAASMNFRFISAEQVSEHNGEPVLHLQRTWFSVFDPMPAQGETDAPPTRGVALLMPGLFGTPEGTLDLLTTALRRKGWVVLRMLSQPSRFTERIEFTLDPATDFRVSVEEIVTVTNGRAAECAYAAQAAFAHIELSRPGLKGLPCVALGFSGGAMTLPTVVAREPSRYAAAVMVGGGVDFWLMSERSNYRSLINAFHEKWVNGKPTADDFRRLDDLYLESAPLDSFHTATALRGKPTLLIQGSADMAVPSPLGDCLWERLGKPERWMVEGAGHETLFMSLPSRYAKMMEWLDKAVPAAAPAPAPAP